MEKETEKSVSFHDMQNTEIGQIDEELITPTIESLSVSEKLSQRSSLFTLITTHAEDDF